MSPREGGRDLDKIVRHVARSSGKMPEMDKRTAKLWPPIYAVRRAAWHVLDHAWEIEDRAE